MMYVWVSVGSAWVWCGLTKGHFEAIDNEWRCGVDLMDYATVQVWLRDVVDLITVCVWTYG